MARRVGQACVRRLSTGPSPPSSGGGGLFRPETVSAFQAERTETQRARWQAFRIVTWVATAAAGGFVAFGQEFPGSPGDGRHALTGVREGAQSAYRRWVVGLPDEGGGSGSGERKGGGLR